MGLKQAAEDQPTDAKKRRRVNFFPIDNGVEANECIKIFLVSSKEEVSVEKGFAVDPVDLNQFFDADGRIFGYQGLKINIFLSSISFHAYADISFQSTSDSGKGITDLKPALQKVFGEFLIEKKDDFLQTFSTEGHYIRNVVSNEAVLHSEAANGKNSISSDQPKAEPITSEHQVLHMAINSMPVGELYCRLVPLVLLLVDGGSPIDITDQGWEIYLVVEKKTDQQGDAHIKLLGFSAVYRFYLYPDNSRLRISQMLVLPPYQGQGHGRHLLEAVNSVAQSENVYDVTIEEPSEYLQHVRTCIDIKRLLAFEPIKPAISSVASCLKHENLSKKTCEFQSNPPAVAVEDVGKSLKINKKQFLQCWEILIYLELDQDNKQCLDNYKTFISDRMRADILGKDSGAAGKQVIEVQNEYDDHGMAFVMFRPRGAKKQDSANTGIEANHANIEEQLNQIVDERMKVIMEVARKASA